MTLYRSCKRAEANTAANGHLNSQMLYAKFYTIAPVDS